MVAGWRPSSTTTGCRRRRGGCGGRSRSRARHFNERGMAACEALLATFTGEGLSGRFAIGDSLTAADLFLVPQIASARRFGVDLDPFPRARAAEQAALATDHARAALPENQ